MEKRSVDRLAVALGLVNLCFALVMYARGMPWLNWGPALFIGVVGGVTGLYPPRQERLPWIPKLPQWLLVGLCVTIFFVVFSLVCMMAGDMYSSRTPWYGWAPMLVAAAALLAIAYLAWLAWRHGPW